MCEIVIIYNSNNHRAYLHMGDAHGLQAFGMLAMLAVLVLEAMILVLEVAFGMLAAMVLVLEAMILVLEVALGMLAMVPAVGFLVSHSSVKNILNSQNPRI